MTADDLRNLLKTSPFIPFRIYMTDGKILDVRHPDYVLIDRRGRVAMVYEADNPESRTYTSYAQITLIHVTRTEPLETASPR
jgi:hypothetical protein